MNHQGTKYTKIDARTDAVARVVVDAAFKVHVQLGPGLLESAYEHCLARELTLRGVPVDRQRPLPIVYEGQRLEAGYRLDLVADGRVIVEIKAVDALAPIHEAQLLTYLRLSGIRLGLLINFNSVLLKTGIRRMAL